MKAEKKSQTEAAMTEESSNHTVSSYESPERIGAGTFLYYLPRVLWRRIHSAFFSARDELWPQKKREAAREDLESIAAIKKLSVDELEEIARSAGLNHLIGLSKAELVDQLWEHYSVVLKEKKAQQVQVEKQDELNKDELYRKAQELDIAGRSHMSKEELKNAVESAS
ncbi:MAG: hypothetical protein ACOH5I_10070 [Oligoflexus sp.]